MMDFPAKCPTNVLKLESFSSISYQVYSFPTDQNRVDDQANGDTGPVALHVQRDKGPRHEQAALLRRLEHLCRNKGLLVASDFKNLELWSFEGGDQTTSMPETVTSILNLAQDELGWTVTQRMKSSLAGVFYPSTLDKGSVLSTKPGPPTSAPATSATFDQTFRASRLLNARAVQANRSLSASTASSSTKPLGDDDDPTTSDERDDPARIYSLFISSVVSFVSFSLAKHHGFIPLNFRTLVSPEPDSPSVLFGPQSRQPRQPQEQIQITTLDAHLTTAGTLIFNPATSAQIGLCRLVNGRLDESGRSQTAMAMPDADNNMPSPDPSTAEHVEFIKSEHGPSNSKPIPCDWQSEKVSLDIWLAPGGTVARYVGPDDDMDHAQSGDGLVVADPFNTQEREKARARLAAKRNSQAWKSDVTTWLSEKGIDLSRSRPRTWIKVQVWMPSVSAATDATPRRAPGNVSNVCLQTILWPASLCFQRARPLTRGKTLDLHKGHVADDGSDWFVSSTDVEDAITFTRSWFLKSNERHTALKTLRQAREAREAEELASKQKNTTVATKRGSDGPFTATGVSSRHSITGEILATNTVYPTPPDGVQSNSAGGVASVDGAGATPSNAPNGGPTFGGPAGRTASIPNEDGDMDMDMWAPNGGVENGQGRKQSNTSAFHLGPDELDSRGGGEMFGDMDEEMFNEPGMTDADFSFFDEPGKEDLFGPDLGANQGDGGDVSAMDDIPGLLDEGGVKLEGSLAAADTSIPDAADAVPAEDADRKQNSSSQPEPPDLSPDQTRNAVSVRQEGSPAVLSTHLPRGNDTRISSTESRTQVISPPLSPTEIMKRVLPDREREQKPESATPSIPPLGPTSEQSRLRSPSFSRRQGNFEPIRFNPAVDATTHKYDNKGRFWFSPADRDLVEQPLRPEKDSMDLSVIPRIGFRKSKRRGKAHQAQMSRVRSNGQARIPRKRRSGSETDDEELERDSLGGEAESSDSSEDSTADAFPTVGKRKRSTDDDGNAMTSSMQLLAVDGVSDTPVSGSNASVGLESLDYHPADWSFSDGFHAGFVDKHRIIELGAKEFVETAQVVADQVISGTLDPLGRCKHVNGLHSDWPSVASTDSTMRLVQSVVQSTFPQAVQCSLEAYTAVEDAPAETTLNAAPICPRPTPHARRSHSQSNATMASGTSSQSRIVKIPPAHVLLRRGDSSLEVLPPALDFWEIFGFGPIGGAKDVTAFCIYPTGQGVESAVHEFLESLGSVYRSCRLGEHVRGELDGISRGLVPVKAQTPPSGAMNLESAMSAVKKSCIHLGKLLPALSASLQNVVVYMVNPFAHPGALVDLCAAFSALFQTYVRTPAIQQSKNVNEIVLQLVPIDFIAGRNAIVVPTQAQFTRLAREVYERCALTEGETTDSFPSNRSASAVLVTQPIPTSIDFKLGSDASTALLHENSCIHVAYSRGIDDRWVSAAWTDNRGDVQHCASYCMSLIPAGPGRSFADIAKEIWDTTVDMIQFQRVHWRVLMVKAGVIASDEIDGVWAAWMSVAAQPTQPPTAMSLIAADTSGSLSLHPTSAAANIFDPQAGSQATPHTTPVSTPQPNTQSPEQTSNAPTPGSGAANAATPGEALAEPDAEARLVDLTDETWMATLAHHLHNSHSVVDYRPALASGYLIKRTGTHDDDAPAVLGVRLVHAQQRTYEPVLKEILSMYRDLGNLARLKGVTDRMRGVLPWHLAAALKAQEALSHLM